MAVAMVLEDGLTLKEAAEECGIAASGVTKGLSRRGRHELTKG